MASDFRRAALVQQEGLLQQLIIQLLGPNVSAVERQKALGACQQRLKFHSFLDTNPTTVEERLSEVASVLRLESRHRDVDRLQRLKSQFLTAPLGTHDADLHHGVLRFLLCLTRDLTARNAPPDDAQAMEIDSGHESVPEMTESDSWATENERSSSELSEWSERDSLDELTPAQIATYEVQPLDWQAYFIPSQLMLSVPSRPPVKQSHESLLECLTKVQLPEVPLSACGLFLHSEADLVLSCLRVLQGRDSSVFRWNEEQQSFSVDPRLQAHQFSAVALRGILTWFSQYGGHTRSLLDWTALVVDMGSRQNLTGSYGRPHPSRAFICPTLSAAAQSLQENLNTTLRPLIQLEHHLESASHETVSLIQLKCLVGSIGRQIQALYQISSQLRQLDRRDKTESQMMCETLDLLYDLAVADYLLGSPAIHHVSELAWSVFVHSLAPLLTQLTAWLFLGDLSSIAEDFFISPVPARHTEEADFWLDAYPLRDGSCPKFLLPVLSAIHDGGKALQFMRSQETGQHFDDYGRLSSVKIGRLETLIPDHWTRDLLSQKFLAHIKSTEQTQTTTSPPQLDTLAQRMASVGNYSGDQAVELLQSENSLPWAYISEEEWTLRAPEVRKESIPLPVRAASKSEDRSTAPQEVLPGTDDTEVLPDSFVRIQEAMENLRARLEAALDTHSTSARRMALTSVLPNATDRRPYTQLREAIFQSAPQSADLPDRELKSARRSVMHVHEAPAEVLLKESLLSTLHARSVEIVRSFVDCLLHELGLMREILILKNVFLLGSPAMCEWTRRFSEQLILGSIPTDLKEFQVITDMQECFLSCHAGEDLPVCGDDEFEQLFFDIRASEWDPRLPESPFWTERSPQEIDNCALIYPLKWPLCLVVNEPRLKRYNTVFLFLLKLQWVSYAVKSNGWCIQQLQGVLTEDSLEAYPNLQDWRQLHKHCHEMNHFVKQLQQYVLENIHASIDLFCKGIQTAQSVSELLNRHDQTLDEITRFSFQTRKKQWRTVHARLLTLFHAILNFCSLCQTMMKTAQSATHARDELLTVMDRVIGQYQEARASVMMILQIYSFSLGGNGELSRLITMLNFNLYYAEYHP